MGRRVNNTVLFYMLSEKVHQVHSGASHQTVTVNLYCVVLNCEQNIHYSWVNICGIYLLVKNNYFTSNKNLKHTAC